MVLNRQRHTDGRHRGNAGRNTAGGLAGLDENAELEAANLPTSIRQNIALNAFEISILNTWSIHNMLDGVRDVFNDAAGILSGGEVSGGVLKPSYIDKTSGKTHTASTGIAGDAFDNVIGGAAGEYWVPDNIISWLKCDFGESQPINAYVLHCPNAGSTIAARMPKTWTFEGSNDDSNWTVLDTVVNASGWGAESRTYEITTANYRYYRLNITANNGDPALTLAEMEISYNEVISIGCEAETQPTNIHAVILADDAAITLNTNLKFYASVDDGATWEQITLADSGDYSATEKILTGSVAVAGTGTTIKYKIECTDATFEFYGVALLWD